MTIDSEIPIDFDLPDATSELVEHDYTDISPAEAFRLFEAQNRHLWESNAELNRRTPCEKPFVMD